MDKTHHAAPKFSFRRKGSVKKNDLQQGSSFECDKISYLSQSEALELQKELQDEYGYTVEQLIELSGLSTATALVKSYPKDCLTKSKGTVLVVCGPGYNGAVGLVCARYLRMFDYRPTIFYPKRQAKVALYASLAEQCERQHIPFLSYMPSEAHLITSAYNLIVDALFGCGFKGPSPEEDLAAVIQTMVKSGVPIASIDVPSGWEIDSDEAQMISDVDSGVQFDPEILISLVAPKRCSRAFRGRAHYLANRFVPPELLRKYDVGLVPYHMTELCVELSLIQPSSPTGGAKLANSASSKDSAEEV